MPDDPDDLNDYFRVRTDGRDGWSFEVGVAEWDGHTPSLRWMPPRHWKSAPDAARPDRARAAALAMPRIFRRCTTCGTVNNAGHLFGRDLCQGCAERHHGVIF